MDKDHQGLSSVCSLVESMHCRCRTVRSYNEIIRQLVLNLAGMCSAASGSTHLGTQAPYIVEIAFKKRW